MAQPFLTVNVNSERESGLVGVVLDPDFANNNYVYIYYTREAEPRRNIISRYTAIGDVAIPGSQQIIMELDLLGPSTHHGGAMHFGPDGKLYVAVGDNSISANSQTLENLHGKMLRINADGSIPEDNPFYNQTTGKNRAIWALGLRNPFNFAFDPATGIMLINDVGENDWEEVNVGEAGANYGWPETEGYTNDPRFKSPIYAYRNARDGQFSTGCSVIGGAFYSPSVKTLPEQYYGKYLFADFCNRWINYLDPVTGQVQNLGFTAGALPVNVSVADNGDIYYLARNVGDGGGLYRLSFEPKATTPAGNITQSQGNPVYTWEAVPGATSYDLYLHRGNNPFDQVMYETGLTAQRLNCNTTICSIDATTLPNGAFYWLVNDSYNLWWRPNNGHWFGPFSFRIAVQPPALPTGFNVEILANGQTKLSWQADANSGWHQVWVGSPGPDFNQAHFMWHQAKDLGCATDTTCELTLTLSSGDYIWYVQPWSPAGFNSGGVQGWAEGTPFTRP